MRIRQTVGIILGVAGVLLSLGHLALMMIFNTQEPYHGFSTWVLLGLALAVTGILLISQDRPRP